MKHLNRLHLLTTFILLTTKPTTSKAQECTDVEGWEDSFADGCNWYADPSDDDGGETRCEAHGNSYKNLGHTANTACCTCGGGEGFLETCEDVAGYLDCGGDTCAFYVNEEVGDDDYEYDDGDTVCASFGWNCAGPSGLTPDEACCICGGGSVRSVAVGEPSAAPVTKAPTKSPTKGPTKPPTTNAPTHFPTEPPTKAPVTDGPTKTPTPPVPEPTKAPTVPIPEPTQAPVTDKPTRAPVTRSPSGWGSESSSSQSGKSSLEELHSHHTYKSDKAAAPPPGGGSSSKTKKSSSSSKSTGKSGSSAGSSSSSMSYGKGKRSSGRRQQKLFF